jgi:leucyl-tRNA synthetase
MIEQFKRMGVMFDWKYALDTSKPEYYRWTQWLFLEMYKHKLAYKKEANVNWCPKDQTVLANEQAQDGVCERCGTPVIQLPLKQWFWKITAYAQRLLDGLEDLDWPEKTKIMQRNWIGKSEGVFIRSKIKDFDYECDIWDSVPQTFRAQTFTVIAPEHPILPELVKGTPQEKDVLAFIEYMKKKKASKRFVIDKEMEGVFTGRFMENPFGTGDLPLWIASYAVMDYGSGLVHCSAHDQRDFEFAKKFGIPLHPVMFPADAKEAKKVRDLAYCYAKDPEGILAEPEEFKGRTWGEARDDIIAFLEKKGIAKAGINYRLRDWLISRQRYWGAPIPIVYDPEGNAHPVPEEHLPWLLPTDVEFKPTGESPLKHSKEFKERTEKLFGRGWTPEYDTMDTFVCSSFYYLRFLADRALNRDLIPKDLEKKWMPVSMYIGGPEHACMHLIYARFVMMVLKDFGYVSNDEPFKKLVHQGLITNKGAKMSKSKGNVVSPDTFIEKHGSDVFRMYLMFMGPFTEGGDWSDTGIKGIDRFVQRLFRLYKENKKIDQDSDFIIGLREKTIKKITDDIHALRFNTALSAFMELLNALEKESGVSKNTLDILAILLAPVAPHLAEELWEMNGNKDFAINQPWPSFDPAKLQASTMTIVVQVNGKLRGELSVSVDIDEADIIAQAKDLPNVQKFLDGKAPKKAIYVKGKLVSLVL